MRSYLFDGPVEYISVGGDMVCRACLVDHASRMGTSVGVLA